MNRPNLKVLAACLALASTCAHANANQVQDGSFESIVVANGTWTNVNSVGAWSSDSNGIEVRNNVEGTAFDGNNFIELDTYGNSSVFQQLTTKPGQSYLLSFAWADRAGVPLSSQGLEVLWHGQVIGSFNGSADWKVEQLTVKALTRVTELEFRAIGTSDSLGTSLDAVSVSPVPEPETYAMMLGGLALLGAAMKRKQR